MRSKHKKKRRALKNQGAPMGARYHLNSRRSAHSETDIAVSARVYPRLFQKEDALFRGLTDDLLPALRQPFTTRLLSAAVLPGYSFRSLPRPAEAGLF